MFQCDCMGIEDYEFKNVVEHLLKRLQNIKELRDYKTETLIKQIRCNLTVHPGIEYTEMDKIVSQLEELWKNRNKDFPNSEYYK